MLNQGFLLASPSKFYSQFSSFSPSKPFSLFFTVFTVFTVKRGMVHRNFLEWGSSHAKSHSIWPWMLRFQNGCFSYPKRLRPKNDPNSIRNPVYEGSNMENGSKSKKILKSSTSEAQSDNLHVFFWSFPTDSKSLLETHLTPASLKKTHVPHRSILEMEDLPCSWQGSKCHKQLLYAQELLDARRFTCIVPFLSQSSPSLERKEIDTIF